MEERDVPPRAYKVQKPEEGARSFRELEAVEHFVLDAIPTTNLREKDNLHVGCGSLDVGICLRSQQSSAPVDEDGRRFAFHDVGKNGDLAMSYKAEQQ
jgi:hypothetical protein